MTYPWYSVIKNSASLQQGDFIYSLYAPVTQFNLLQYKNRRSRTNGVTIKWQKSNWIVLTQSCDINPSNNKPIEYVTICPVTTFDKFLRDNPAYGANKDMRKKVLENKVVGLHILKPRAKGMPFIVNFRDIRILPKDFLEEFRKEQNRKTKLRLNSPYLEAMMMRFGIVYTRVGYPSVFPKDKDLKRFSA